MVVLFMGKQNSLLGYLVYEKDLVRNIEVKEVGQKCEITEGLGKLTTEACREVEALKLAELHPNKAPLKKVIDKFNLAVPESFEGFGEVLRNCKKYRAYLPDHTIKSTSSKMGSGAR